MSGKTPSWIAADWGTSNLRVWLIGKDGAVLDRAVSNDGMGGLARNEYEPALLRLIEPWLGGGALPVLACGMVGSRQGWIEAPYTAAPCPAEPVLVAAPVQDNRFSVHIAAGVKQQDPADVMRGEETQIAGLLARKPDFDGVACLPGTHTKWVRISAGEICHFQTFMTGELFALLSKQSVLRHSIGADGWDADAFTEAFEAVLDRPQLLATRLFGLRAESLVAELSPEKARARLSGYLLGLEVAGAKPYWLGQEIAMIGANALSDSYASVLRAQGSPVEIHDAEALTLAGLAAVHQALEVA